jgi:pimeloyl-ACP methyl ester carboxylesterase
MMTSTPGVITDEPTWFGEQDVPLFGWLARPLTKEIRGGVVIVPSVGYEARNAKIAVRELARALARSGFVALRFDLHGTGDSAKDFADILPNPGWLTDIVSAVKFLRTAGVETVSVVGMRLGATLAAVAGSDQDLALSSVVLWDPCESGWHYLRELRALEALRREEFTERDDGSVETAEFLFSKEMVVGLRALELSALVDQYHVKRSLIIVRTTRPLSSALESRLRDIGAEFQSTEEQEALLEVLPFEAASPNVTIKMIVEWLSETAEPMSTELSFTLEAQTLLAGSGATNVIRERASFLGPQEIFAMVSEPLHPLGGPWIILIGNIHDDHMGQSRMWVELARRWAQSGLRCARVDLSGLGESTRPGQEIASEPFDPRWVNDVVTLGHVLDPDDPSNTVFVGFSGAGPVAIEAVLELHSRGICVISPQLGRNVIHAMLQLQGRSTRFSRMAVKVLRQLIDSHPFIVTTLWETFRRIFPRKWSGDTLGDIYRTGADVLMLGSAQDQSIFSRVPIVRSLEGRRDESANEYPVIVISDLDHAMTFAGGRLRVLMILEEHVRKTFSVESNG